MKLKNRRKKEATQHGIKYRVTMCVVVMALWIAFCVWVRSWLGVIVLPFIYDAYITKKIPWSWWKNPAS